MTQVQTAPSPLSSIPNGDLFSHTPESRQPDNKHGRATRLISAAEQLLSVLCRGQALEAKILRSAMIADFGGSDSEGAWQWKDVYEVQELAGLMFVRKYRDALARREPLAALATLEKLQDLLPRGFLPSVVLMNPPFSTSPTMTKTSPSVAGRHVFSALNRLAEGGRLVAITGRNFAPDSAKWREAFVRLQGIGRIVFSAALAGKLYANTKRR